MAPGMQLVVVRHGKYGAGDHLSDDGRRAIASVADKLIANYLRDIDFLSPEKARGYLSSLPTDKPVILVSHVDICTLLLELFGSSISLDRGEAALITDEQNTVKL